MKPEHANLEQRLVTHTYTAPSGAVVVITSVPAEVLDFEDSSEVVYSIDVATKIQQLTDAALASAPPGSVIARNFTDDPVRPHADYEFRFIGPEANFSNATIQTWRLVFDKTYNSIKTALKGSANLNKLTNSIFPRLSFVGPGSIVLGVSTRDQQKLFEFEDRTLDAADHAIRLIIDTSLWLDGNQDLSIELAGNPNLLDSMLQAVEELSPSTDAINAVILQRPGGKMPVQFSREKREHAKKRRIELRLAGHGESRTIVLVGRVGRIDDVGYVQLRDIGAGPYWQGSRADTTFMPNLLPMLLENFGKQVQVTAIQPKESGNWSTSKIEIVEVTRFVGNRE